jgi:DinB superfamily
VTGAQHLVDTLTNLLEGDPWYGPSLKAALQGITAVASAARPLANAHTIWEIAAHMDAWNRVCLRRLEGETVGEPEINFEGPATISPEQWRIVLARLDESCRLLIARARGMSDAELAVVISGEAYRADFLLEGVGQHWVYHAGQIALLGRSVS